MRFIVLVLISSSFAFAQTKTTQALDDKYEGLSLFFYKNTLRMLNQTDDKEFDELIKDIDKMKFLMIDKNKSTFSAADYKNLKTSYGKEQYEEMMSGRFEGKNFDVYLREKDGEVKGTVILASDSSSLFVLDILGKIALDKAPALFKSIDNSTDIGKKIKAFAGIEEKDEKEKDKKSETKKNDHSNNFN
ncbi:MAG: DUF4252 domain-containing protein [Cyclobacteriaceae bacterium]|nr:DUF4252 domain-containing protein [Cyclobacteriaceae bacterium]